MNPNRMSRSSRRSKQGCPGCAGEEGYILAAVIIMLAVLMIFMAGAVPKVREDIRRDQEIETMHRGKQYIRAVQLYYHKFRHFPPNVDALEDTNMQRFLRKRYLDPLTGQDDWVPVLYGQNKAPLTMGYFGQPLTMGAAVLTPAAGSNSGSNNGAGGTPIPTAFPTSFSGSNSGLTPSAGMPMGNGAGIMGFSPAADKDSILIYKTKTHYTEWEFVYDPASDRGFGGSTYGPPPTPPTNTGAPGFPGANPSPTHP